MAHKTIQCRLVASAATRQALWHLMAELNTPLVNELLVRVSLDPDFEQWKSRGKIPSSLVANLFKSLKTDPRFAGQPSRFYTSAIRTVDYIYRSWLALLKDLRQKLAFRESRLELLKSDAELVEWCGHSLDEIRARAADTLTQVVLQEQPESRSKLFNLLLKRYREQPDNLDCSALLYLLKNQCQVTHEEEDTEKFAKRRRKAQILVERLRKRLTESRRPKGRDLTGHEWLETLEIATITVPSNEEEAALWQRKLLTESRSIPFPLLFETNEDLTWFRNEKGRICVRLPGLKEHVYQGYCARRQLHYFQRFLEDQETKRQSGDQHSSGLFTLRSATLCWQEGQGKGEPWQVHRLILHCTVETRLWTEEGTEQVRREKAVEVTRVLDNMNSRTDLSKNQQNYVDRLNSTLARINGSFQRPSKPLYQGQPNILVGVSLGLKQPATVAVVEGNTGKVLAYRNTRQLLGKNYRLLNRQRWKQQRNAHERKKAQRRSDSTQYSESNLGEYDDRLIAKAIVELATDYQAGSIVLPKMEDVREIIQSEMEARAEQKHPGNIEAQKAYAREYLSSIHRWSYGRLNSCIRGKAAQVSIGIELGKQSFQGSQQKKAAEMAIAAYQNRQKPES